VKLLFDENLSPKLAVKLAALYPDSTHVSHVGLERADDASVWQYARDYSFCVVTKDADFEEISLRLGSPPKLVWLRRGNCSVDDTAQMLSANAEAVRAFLEHTQNSVLVIT
jgi:predicted nuclease of predicted toxin-antitoxin system